MSWLQKLFGNTAHNNDAAAPDETPIAPVIAQPFAGLRTHRFGHYSDNNKTFAQAQQWYSADRHFKEKQYSAMFADFFGYLRDPDPEYNNVQFAPEGETGFTFSLEQGSRCIEGVCDGGQLTAITTLAVMETPSTAVMRRLLDLNFKLSYCRCALNDSNGLCMMMDSTVEMASPEKMYYGLRELATKADRQDDLLLADFTNLQPPGNNGQIPLPANELDVKYTFFRQWIQEALDRAAALNADSFAGAIAYLFLTLIYRIDFLIVPEATLLAELERIHNLYWEKKEEIPLVERNQKMKEAVTGLLGITKEVFADSVYTSKSTFAMAAPARMDKVKEHINTANKESRWYVDNKYPELAPVLAEYGVVYDAFISSMPAVLTALSVIVMAVWHPDFFTALGMEKPFYDKAGETFQQAAIEAAVDKAIADHGEKYPELTWDHGRLRWTSQYDFATSFTEQMAGLNMEVKR